MQEIDRFNDDITAFCKNCDDPMVRAAPECILAFWEVHRRLPDKYGWRFTSEDALRDQVKGVSSSDTLNHLYWNDQARNVEAYSLMTMWRAAELLRSSIQNLNAGQLVPSAVLARSLLELSTAYLIHANTVAKVFSELEFEPNTVTISKEFEERVVKMIWGTRLGNPEPHLQQVNVMTLIQKLSRNPNAKDLLPHYEYLCEIAHPNVVGNARYWSHVEGLNSDGSEIRTLKHCAEGSQAEEIRRRVIWSLAWSAASTRNAFAFFSNSLQALISKLNTLSA